MRKILFLLSAVVLLSGCSEDTVDNTGSEVRPADKPSVEIGENGHWWIDGVDTGVSASGPPGSDGTAPAVEIGENGNWWIDGVDTGVSATGQPGSDGTAPAVEIGENGHWWVDGVDTGVSASASAPEIVSVEWAGTTLTVTFSDGRVVSVEAGTLAVQLPESADGFAQQWFRLAPQVSSLSHVSYVWLLDGEEISTDRELVHVFAEAGTYALTLRATNAVGSAERTVAVRIEAPAQAYSPWTNRVYAFVRAPGQHANAFPATPAGSTAESVLAAVENTIVSRGLVSLGGYGGSIVMGFDHTVVNGPGADFLVHGNNFGGFAEPGVIEVSWDANGNGLPDDTWYQIAGSEYAAPTALHNYALTYYNPATDTERPEGETRMRWSDNQGETGYISTHWPNWAGDSIATGGSLYAQTGTLAFEFGYADNWPNNDARAQIDIDWAVDAAGHPAHLKGIDFVRVYTGVFSFGGALGEISTEVTGAEDLRP